MKLSWQSWIWSVLFTGLVSQAAEERSQVSGNVRDASEAAIAEAAITAVNEGSGIRRSIRSSASGEYAIAGLPAGTYKITVRKPGFQTIARLNVRLAPAASVRVDFPMQVGSMREVITIVDEPALSNTNDASIGTLANRQLLDALPLNGRGILGLIHLAPGVIATPATSGEAGQFTSSGQRPNANYFSVDGLSANTGVSGSGTPAQFSGGTLPAMTAFGGMQTLASTEGIQEVRIQTSSFAPEFGRAPGANLGITTRGGANEWHGSGLYLWRNEALNANDWFANAAGLSRSASRLNNGGAAFGGPLRRDRSFFFANFESLRLDQPRSWRFAVPSQASRQAAPLSYRPLVNAFPIANLGALAGGLAEFAANISLPASLHAGSFRLDHALSSRVNLFARFQRAPSSSQSGFSQVDHSSFSNDSFSMGAAAVHSPNVISDLRFNVTRTAVASNWASTGAGGATPIDLRSLFPATPVAGTVLYGFGLGGVGQLLSGEGSQSRQTQWNLIETLGWTKGAHGIRAGIDYKRLAPSRDRIAASFAASFESLGDLLAGRPIGVSSAQADQASSLIETLSLFGQDTWQVTNRLTVTYGLRWELTPAPSYRASGIPLPVLLPLNTTGAQATALPVWPTRYTQFAPRIGAAYKFPFSMLVRAGWGLFYEAEFGVATDPINAFPYNRWQFSTSPSPVGTTLSQTAAGFGYAPGLRLPYAREWNVSMERMFGDRSALSVSTIHSSGRHLLRRQAMPLAAQASSPIATNNGTSDYHALALQYRQRLADGFLGQASYTWSHSLDNGSWDSATYLGGDGVLSDRGRSSFDARQNLSAGVSYLLRGRSVFLSNWTWSAFVAARSGFPLDVLTTENLLGLGFDDYRRPDLNAGVPVWLMDSSAPGGRRLNPAAFVSPSGMRQGSLGRNAISGFGLAQVDLGLTRDFAVGRESVLQVRVESYNLTNRAQFGDPVRYLNSPLFGRPVSMLNLMLGSGTPHSGLAPSFQTGGPRTLQITIRFRF